jgi:hypothetical protein
MIAKSVSKARLLINLKLNKERRTIVKVITVSRSDEVNLRLAKANLIAVNSVIYGSCHRLRFLNNFRSMLGEHTP